MSADSTMEQGFDGGSIKPPLESFLDDKLKSPNIKNRTLKLGESRYFTKLVLENGAVQIPSPDYSSNLDQKYKQSREFLALMGPVGYPGETPSSNSDRTKVVQMASLLVVLTGNSEKTAPNGKILLLELQSLIIAKLMLSARELKRQGKEIDPRLPDILVTAIDNLREGGSLKQGQNTIKPDHRFSPSLNIFNQLVPSDSSGGKAFTREFPARLKQRGDKPAAQDIDGFWLVLCGGMEGNIVPQVEKRFGVIDKVVQMGVVHSMAPKPDSLAQHEGRDPQGGFYGRVNAIRETERKRQRKYGV